MKFDVKEIQPFAIAGAVAGTSAWLIAQALQLIKPITLTFATVDVRSKLVSGFGTGLGEKIFGLIGGIQVPNVLILIASAIVITLIGAFVASLFSPFAKANVVWRWAWVFFTGSIIGTWLLSGFKTSALTGAVTPPGVIVLAIFSVIVAFVVNFAYSNIPPLKRQMPQLP